MKLRTGRSVYKLPEHSQVLLVIIEGNQKHNQDVDYVLIQIDKRELPIGKKLRHVRGIPTGYFVFTNKIEFWPVPDKPYKARVRYVPPITEC